MKLEKLFMENADMCMNMIDKMEQYGYLRDGLIFIVDKTNINQIMISSKYGSAFNGLKNTKHKFADIPIFIYDWTLGYKVGE